MLEACGCETLNIVQLNQIPSPARWGYAFETAASARYTPSQMCHLSWVLDEKVLPPAVRSFGAFLSIHTDLLQLPLPLRFQHLDTSTVFLLFCWKTAAEKHGKTETINPSRSIESRDVVDEDRLGRRHDKHWWLLLSIFLKILPPPNLQMAIWQSNVQVLWDDMMIDVGIFGSYLIDSERKFMGFGSSNPHIFLQFDICFDTDWKCLFDTDSNMLRDAPWSNWRGPPWSRCQQKLRRGFSDSPFEQVCNGLHMHESHADTTSSHMFHEHAHKLDLRSWHQWPLDGPHV